MSWILEHFDEYVEYRKRLDREVREIIKIKDAKFINDIKQVLN